MMATDLNRTCQPPLEHVLATGAVLATSDPGGGVLQDVGDCLPQFRFTNVPGGCPSLV